MTKQKQIKVTKKGNAIVDVKLGKKNLVLAGDFTVQIARADIFPMETQSLPRELLFEIFESIKGEKMIPLYPPMWIHRVSGEEVQVTIEFSEHAAYWDGNLNPHFYFDSLRKLAKKKKSLSVLQYEDDGKWIHLSLGTTLTAKTVEEAYESVVPLFLFLHNPLQELDTYVGKKVQEIS